MSSEIAATGLIDRLSVWLESKRVQYAITALIVINAITLGLETSASVMAQIGPALLLIDKLILSVFVVEITLRILVHRWRFFRDPWSLFDFVVVGIALVPASSGLSVLRSLRILRVLRLITVVPKMRMVVRSLLAAVPGLGVIAALLSLLFYVFAVIATKLFGAAFPDWFGTIGESAYTLFQVMTLESWSMGIVRPVMERFPFAWMFFIPFILIATFTMLNLFIALIVNSMQIEQSEENQAAMQEVKDEIDTAAAKETEVILAELTALRQEMREMRAQMQGGGNVGA